MKFVVGEANPTPPTRACSGWKRILGGHYFRSPIERLLTTGEWGIHRHKPCPQSYREGYSRPWRGVCTTIKRLHTHKKEGDTQPYNGSTLPQKGVCTTIKRFDTTIERGIHHHKTGPHHQGGGYMFAFLSGSCSFQMAKAFPTNFRSEQGVSAAVVRRCRIDEFCDVCIFLIASLFWVMFPTVQQVIKRAPHYLWYCQGLNYFRCCVITIYSKNVAITSNRTKIRGKKITWTNFCAKRFGCFLSDDVFYFG